MPNSELINKTFTLPDNIKDYIDVVKRKYEKDTIGYGMESGVLKYEDMKNLKKFFDGYVKENNTVNIPNDEKNVEYKLHGGDMMRKWVEKTLSTSRDAIDGEKRTRMKAGEENMYKKPHTKDNSKNPTKVRLPDVQTSSDEIDGNYTTYSESLEKEIEGVKYLIEYMNNNKKII